MATYRFELNDKPSRNGKYSVFLRVTVNGIRKKLKTSIEVNRKSDWNPTPKVIIGSDLQNQILKLGT
ncbi:hypothetical protein BFINE_02910 [Bacteroides finegoldii DSM 17565]|nr:hypothetical protein BFINE_02910 [Bacteroides finegoldii DSM 17565]